MHPRENGSKRCGSRSVALRRISGLLRERSASLRKTPADRFSRMSLRICRTSAWGHLHSEISFTAICV